MIARGLAFFVVIAAASWSLLSSLSQAQSEDGSAASQHIPWAALIIEQDAYSNAPSPSAAPRSGDAEMLRDFADAHRAAPIFYISNKDAERMRQGVLDFADRLRPGQPVMVYYSGLGAPDAVARDNLMIAQNAPDSVMRGAAQGVFNAQYHMRFLDEVIEPISARDPKSIIAFFDSRRPDAAQNHRARSGFAPWRPAPEGAAIFYSSEMDGEILLSSMAAQNQRLRVSQSLSAFGSALALALSKNPSLPVSDFLNELTPLMTDLSSAQRPELVNGLNYSAQHAYCVVESQGKCRASGPVVLTMEDYAQVEPGASITLDVLGNDLIEGAPALLSAPLAQLELDNNRQFPRHCGIVRVLNNRFEVSFSNICDIDFSFGYCLRDESGVCHPGTVQVRGPVQTAQAAPTQPSEAPGSFAMSTAAGCASPTLTTDMDAGLKNIGVTRLGIQAPCSPSEAVIVTFAGFDMQTKLDAQGNGSMLLFSMESVDTAIVTFSNGVSKAVDVNASGLDDIDRVILGWSGPVDLNLHAREYGAQLGGEFDVWSGNPRTPADAKKASRLDRRGYGFWMGVGEFGGPQVEVYTRLRHRNDSRGAIRIETDFASRGDNSTREYCGDAPHASVQFSSRRLIAGKAEKSRRGRFQAVSCDATLGPDERYNSKQIRDISIR